MSKELGRGEKEWKAGEETAREKLAIAGKLGAAFAPEASRDPPARQSGAR